MASLYRSWPDSNNPAPLLFSWQNLRLTHTLLRDSEPTLAQQLGRLLQRFNQPLQTGTSAERRYIGFYPLLEELGADAIVRIIACLTTVVEQSIKQPTSQPNSARSFKQLLNEWIDLGEWLVRAASVH